VENLYSFECTNYEQVLALFHEGLKNRVVGTHKMNLSSSRSHTVFTLTLEQTDLNAAGDADNMVVSKL
jgi:Kinesin motor domain